MGGKQLHEKDREHKKDEEEMPCHHYSIVKVCIKTSFNAGGVSAVTMKIFFHGVHRSVEDWDEPGNYCYHRSLGWIRLLYGNKECICIKKGEFSITVI